MKKIVTTSGRRPPRRGKLPLLIAAAVALVALAVVLNSSHVARRPSPDTPGSTPVTSPAAPVASTEARPATSDATPTASATAAAPAATPGLKPASTGSASAVSDAQKAPAKKPAEPTLPPAQLQKTIFTNEVENMVEQVSRENFSSLEPPRVTLSQEEILAYLRQPVEIFDDDDEETVRAKERTAETKAAALDYIAQGGTFNQFLRDMAAAATEEKAMVDDVRFEMRRILDAEGPEAAQAYLDKANKGLREAGLKEVHLSPFFVKRWMEKREKDKASQEK